MVTEGSEAVLINTDISQYLYNLIKEKKDNP
jgi:hypothetical protein